MRRPLLLAAIVVATFGLTSVISTAQQNSQAAGGRVRGAGRGAAIRSPEVHSDGRVTFRLIAPNAREVAVALGTNTLPMQKDPQGLWSVTTDPLTPDYYTYAIVLDGTRINDPNNRNVQTAFGSFQSIFVIPGSEPWLRVASAPHGAVTRHRFHSTVAGDDRDFFVYTPADYDARRRRPYPVLYLLHGLGDDAERWMNGGGAPVIFDSLIAQRRAVPMVVVTTLGYGVSSGPAGRGPDIITGYAKSLLTEVMPMVDKAYNVSADRQARAIAGLSMGGAEALYVGLNNVDKFAWMASFSGAFVMWPDARDGGGPERGASPAIADMVFEENFPRLDASVNHEIRRLWIACGTADGLITVNRQFRAWLTSKNVKFSETEIPDIGHVWPLWRRNLAEFAQTVFQPAPR